MNDKSIEQEIIAKCLTAPRLVNAQNVARISA
jgi:hypothetical protein